MKANQNIEEEKWAALARKLFDSETPSSSIASELSGDEWPETVKSGKEIDALAQKLDLYFQLKSYQGEAAWEKVQGRMQEKPQARRTIIRSMLARPLLRLAATLLLAALLTVAGYEIYTGRQMRSQLVELSGLSASVLSVTLPDGSVVSLNSDTKIIYPRQFGGPTREVTIEGEAFFEVKRNPEKPFIIHAGTAQVKVLGTSFNVCAYPGAREMEVIVRTGKVQVLNQNLQTKQPDQLILTPGEKGTLVHASNALLKSTNEDLNYLAWKTHELIFRDASLNEVIQQLEKVYKVTIRLQDPVMGNQLFSGHFNNNPLELVLNVIGTVYSLESQQVDGTYILKAKS